MYEFRHAYTSHSIFLYIINYEKGSFFSKNEIFRKWAREKFKIEDAVFSPDKKTLQFNVKTPRIKAIRLFCEKRTSTLND